MMIDVNSIITVSEASQDFSRVMRMADQTGRVVILKNDRPKYVLYDLEQCPEIEMTDDEKIDFVAARILKRFKPAFMELAE